MYLTQVKVVVFTVISVTLYYGFLGSAPFKIVHGIYSQQINYAHAYPESIWCVCS